MNTSRWRFWTAAVAVIVVTLLLVRWRDAEQSPAGSSGSAAERDAADGPRRSRSSVAQTAQPTAKDERADDAPTGSRFSARRRARDPETVPADPVPAPRKRRRGLGHGVDPCGPLFEPSTPAGYDVYETQGVTIAWPEELEPAEPTALAYTAAGLLEEAAWLTATPRRKRVTIVLYPTIEVLREKTGAPSWSDGLYDGAVHLSVEPEQSFGVPLRTLRHELMHAQLHAGVGCMPLWFDEGVAMYFSARPPRDIWITMLRQREALDFEILRDGVIGEVKDETVQFAYAQSLAMVLFVVDRSGEAGLREAAHDLREHVREGTSGVRLWSEHHPGVGKRELLGGLAARIFGMPLGSELDGVLDAPVCCHGLRPADFACRVPSTPPPRRRRRWIDQSQTPAAICY